LFTWLFAAGLKSKEPDEQSFKSQIQLILEYLYINLNFTGSTIQLAA